MVQKWKDRKWESDRKVEGYEREKERAVVKVLKENILYNFETPHAIINDQGTHFGNKLLETLMIKYEAVHKISTSYHPQTNRQVKLANRERKQISFWVY